MIAAFPDLNLLLISSGIEFWFVEVVPRYKANLHMHKKYGHEEHRDRIFILVINQLDAQNLFYNKFISCLYVFRAPCAQLIVKQILCIKLVNY